MTKELPLPQLKRLAIALLATVLLAGVATAQTIQWSTPGSGTPLPLQEAFVQQHAVLPDGALQLSWAVTPGYYLYQDSLQVSGADGPVALDLPQAERTEDMTFGETWVYRGDIQLTLPPQQGTLTVEWQGCQEDGICYPPQSTEISLASVATTPPAPAAAQSPAPAALTLADEPGLMDRLGARGVPILLAAFFGFGLALAFTPCVLPMIPILGGLLARDGAGLTRRRGFMLSSAYVFAMAAAFGLLGLAAAATGQNLQMALQSPIALGLIIGLFALLALSMFGLFEVSLPSAWLARLQGPVGARRGTVGGALGLGFTSALVVGPCVTAPFGGGASVYRTDR